MAIRDFRQLIAWQRSAELRREVLAFTARLPCKADRDFCWNIRRSARSAPSNVAEGFVRYGHREFLHFLKIARASLAETQNHLLDAREQRYIDHATFERCWRLSVRGSAAVAALMDSLQRRHRKPRASNESVE
jgi:four helix bundle protein